MILYPIGSTQACLCAAEQLKEHGITLTDHPMPEVTHILLDVPSFDDTGYLRGGGNIEGVLERLPPSLTVIGGGLNNPALADYRKRDLLQDEIYVAGNAAITADCAIRIAGEQMKATFQDCPALILGWGRIGKCLTRLLSGLGCSVTVAARKESDRAMVTSLGIGAVDYFQIPGILKQYRLIFNTVPQTVLTRQPPEDCICIDLASSRGIIAEGVLWARGLPGIYAPFSSGKLIAERILHYSKEERR